MKMKVATFNLLNLALPNTPVYGQTGYTSAEYAKKLAWTAGQLTAMDADLVGFQEVFHRQALAEAIDRSGLYAGAALHVADETGDLPRVALLSRLPLQTVEVIKDFPAAARLDIDGQLVPFTSFHRPVLRAVVVLPNGQSATVLVVHLKSKRPMNPDEAPRHDDWEDTKGSVRSLLLRACEAAALRRIILDEIQNRDQPLILMGDLNDSTHAVTSDLLQGKTPQRNYPAEVKAKLWDSLLYSCADLQVRRSYKDVYFTHLHNSHYESLDHIFLSQEFVNENPAHLAGFEYMRLYNDHLLDPALTTDKPVNWVSDHGQVVVSLKFRGPETTA